MDGNMELTQSIIAMQHTNKKGPICGIGAAGMWPLSIIFKCVYMCIGLMPVPKVMAIVCMTFQRY